MDAGRNAGTGEIVVINSRSSVFSVRMQQRQAGGRFCRSAGQSCDNSVRRHKQATYYILVTRGADGNYDGLGDSNKSSNFANNFNNGKEGMRPENSLKAEQNKNARKFVKDLFDSIVANPSDNSAKKAISIAALSKDAISVMESISGIKIKENTKLAVSSNFLKHIYDNHYGKNEKDPGNNEPLTDEDIANIVDIMTSPDMIVYSGKDRETGAHVFTLLKENAKGTYSLIDLYANSDGKLKPKTLYNSKKSISGQVMRLSQPSTSETRTRSIAAPKNFATLSNHFSGAKVIQNFENPKLFSKSAENKELSKK